MHKFIPQAKHEITDDDIQAVTRVLRSDCITRGPERDRLEQRLCDMMGVRYAVTMVNGTASLHAALETAKNSYSSTIPIDVISPNITFCAIKNAAELARLHFRAIDIDPYTLHSLTPIFFNIPAAFVPMDYAGLPYRRPSNMLEDVLQHLLVIRDACHSLGSWMGRSPIIGELGMAVFSFHAIKHVTGGEGGAVVTNDLNHYQFLKSFRDNGRVLATYVRLGNNYHLSEINCALINSQLERLGENVEKLRSLAYRYSVAFGEAFPDGRVIFPQTGADHCWHLYVLQFPFEDVMERELFRGLLRAKGVGTQVHYSPIVPKMFRFSEIVYPRLLSLPLYPSLVLEEQDFVIRTVVETAKEHFKWT